MRRIGEFDTGNTFTGRLQLRGLLADQLSGKLLIHGGIKFQYLAGKSIQGFETLAVQPAAYRTRWPPATLI